MPNKITYTIKTSDGKEHQVSKENIDKHGIQAYADAYEGATIRMRDSKKGDYDIPLSNYNDAKAQGLHAFSWEHLPPKAQPQAKQQVAQKQSTQQVATITPGTPMTAAQKAQVLNNANNIIAQSQSDLSRTMRKFDYAKQNTGLDVKPIKLGENRKIIKQSSFNPQTGKKEESYLTESGNIHDSYANASTEQNAIDDFKEQEKHSKLENQLNAAYKERDSITKALQRRMAELDKQGGHGLLRQFADAMSPDLAMHSSPRDYEMDEEYGALMSAARKNNSTIQILEDKKKGRMNNFWSTLGATFSNGYTFTDGLSGVRDNIAILNANKRADKINRKRQRGEMLTNEEDAFDKALLANLVNEEIEGTYGQEYGALARAAKITASTADVVKDFLLSGGTGITLTKGVAKGVMNAGAKYLTKKAGESLLKASAKAFGRGLLKATGIGVGSLAGGALITNTTGIGKTAEEMSKQVTGRVGVDQHGNYIFTDSKDLMHAFIEAERSMIGENASEMLGEFIPGSKVLKKGLEKIGLSKISSYLTSIGNKSWAKNYGKLLEAAGWNGLPGEGLEEYAGIAYNSLTGDSEGGIATLGDARTHIDIWLGCAAAGALLGAPNVVALGANTAQYYRYKHATNKAAQQAKSQLTADRWNALQERIDNTENQDLTNLMLEVYTNKELSPKQKKAVFNYTDNLVRMRGYNIGSINNADATRDEKGEKELHKEENIGNAYATGYHATEDELANIKNELELRHRQLTETFKDDPSALQQIEDDPKAFLQGLKESEVGGEKAKVINAYEETRAAYDGMIQRVKDNIDDAITENNTIIEQRTHQDGNIYSATMKLDDRKVYVVGGNVQMNEDGKGIDHEKSSSSVMIRDAETGKIEMVDPSAILSVDTPVNAEEEKATSSEQIKQTYAQEQANKIDGVLEFKAGDTYSILGEDQKQHTIQIIGEAIDEKTKQPNPDMVMASIDGLEPTMLPKEQIQAMNDEENLWRLDQSLKQGEEVESTTPHSAQSYNLNDEITLINEDGKPVRGSITTDQNEDGKFEVYTEEPINGKRVNLFTAEELDAMTGKQQEQTNQAPVQEEQGEQTESPALVAENATTQKEDVAGLNDGTIAENATVQKEETPQHQPTALERIPTNEQGEPIYEQADPETAWDAIVEQTEGDESIAQSVADGMVADMEAAVRRAEKAKVKGGTTIAEKIAAEKERVATIEQAKATLEHWKKIASTNSRRQEAIQAEESRKAKEAALLRKEQEEKERAIESEPKPIGKGIFGNIYNQFKGKAKEAVDFLMKKKDGEAIGALHHKDIGDIDLVWGKEGTAKSDGFGLAKLAKYHPEVLSNLQEVLDDMIVTKRTDNRVQLESAKYQAAVRLTWDEKKKTWLLTMFEKKNSALSNTTDTDKTHEGKRNDTATPQDTAFSAGKVSETSNAVQENAEKTSENEAKELATNAVVEALVRVGVPVEVVSDEAAKGVLPLGAEKHVVYHGSGAKFDHFDHSHMGEGEGAQAYGWGSYVTEVEGIGKKYAQAMLKEKYKENRTINEMARDRLISDGSKDESLKYLNDLLKEEWVDKKRVKAQIKIIETGKFLPEGKVSLYTVDIPDNTGKNYLDWESDIPVKEKNRIRIALTKSIIDKMGSATSSERQDVRNSISTEFRLDVRNFKGIYKLMSSYTSPQEASELLRNLGYTGISYPAQYLSGGRSDGARNYVIFDEKDLKITNRVEFMKSPDGVVYGWTIGGRIYLTKAGLNPETPIHEYTHIWANAMKVHNMKGWKSIKDLLVDTPIWDEVLNDENYSEIRNDEDSVASEVLSRISGKENAKRMEEEAQKVIADSKDLIEKAETLSVLNRVRKALKTFWSWVGKELFDIEKFNSINEVTDRVLYDLVNGTALQVQNETTRVETNPTEAQKEAGNYKKGHIKVDGMNITIEQPKGSIRRGKDASGKEWESEMHNTYGYIRGTEGVDGDHIDIFLSDNPNEGNVFVVDQVNKDGSFDEHKVMYGFADKESARQAYLSNYEDGWQGLGNITEVSKEEFKKWIGSSKRKTKPFAEYKGIIKSNKSVSSPVAMSEDEYLTSKGLNGNMTDYMLDKLRIPHSETARQQKQREKEAARVRADFDNQKEEARKEYRQKIAKGELREPTKQEAKEREIAKLIKTANGHEDNPSVQAARRLLAKRGVDWRTDKGDTSDNDWLKSKEDGKSNVVHSFGNSASQNDTSIKLSDTSFAKMKNGEQKAEEEIGWLVDHNIRLKENSRKLDEIAHLLFDGDNIDSNRESALREEAKKILEENEKLSRDYQKNYSDKYFGTDDITANYILQEANERLIALGVKPVKESYYFQNRKNEVAQNAVVHLLKRIGIPVHFISRVGAEASGQGNSRGWTNGLDIWLTKDNINAETPVHEYTHIWTFALMKNNPKLWAEIKNLLKDSEWVDTIQSMDEYKYTLDNEDLLYSEVLSRISGERNGEKFESMAFKLIEEVNSVEKKVDLKRGLEKLRDALKRFWEWVGVNLFGMKEFKSVDDVCDRVLFDLLNASDIARTEEMREYYEEEREMNTIIDKAKEDGTYLKTPNGEDTKLPEKVWAYARTKKFKTQLSDRLNLILNESKEDFKDWEKEEFRDLFKKHGLLEEHNEPGRFLVSQFMYSEKYYDRKGKMQEEAQETMNSGKGGENVSSVKSVDMRDAEYIKAVENNDTETIQRLLSEEAERKGYSKDSSYQGSLAFNGSAPYQNAYFETKEERKEAWENDEYEDTMSLGDYVDSGIDTNNLEWNLTDPMALRQADPDRREAIENLRQTVRSNSKTITIYRAVDANIKENEIRNGDWVTPSRSYAEYHIGLQDWENGRIIEQEVSIDDLWWDGNDIAEWGYDNGKGEVYKNTPNNRKMFEVTYDDKGNIIPLSKRFNDQVEDERFRNDEELEEANQRFNEELDNLTEENADKVTLWLGKPSNVLLSSGIENKPLKLYGNKVIKKMKKHGFALDELRDLPKAVADPIAVFDNLGRFGNRSILTELTTEQGNFLVTIDMGKGEKDVDFNIVSSVFGKGKSKIVSWIERGLATYINKKKALNYLHHSAPIAEALSNSRLSSAANIVKSFENPTNSSEKVLDRKTAQAEEVAEKERQQMAERANELAETLHLDNVEIVTDASTLEGKKAKAKGFYSTSTGKITIVIPNHSNIADVEKTLLHEAVAHHGLRKLFGEHFDNFLDNVFKNASEDVRREIVKLAAKNKWDFRIATEEYLASLAEDTNFENMPNGLWDKVKRLFLDMLRSIGLLKQKDGELNDNELRYILWRSYKNLKEKGQSNSILNKAEDIAMQHRLKVGNYAPQEEGKAKVSEKPHKTEKVDNNTTLYREDEPEVTARTIYEDAVKDTGKMSMLSALAHTYSKEGRERFKHKFSESYFDYSRSIKQLQDAISKASGRKLEEFEEVWKSLNAKSSIDSEEINLAMLRYISPLSIHIAEMIRGVKMDGQQLTLDDVEVYMNALHGIERNAYMANSELKSLVNKKLEKWKENRLKKLRDSGMSKEEALSIIATEEADKRDEITQLNMGKTRKDYSGLTALFSDENTNNIDVAILEERAQKYVDAFEEAVGKDKVDEMWKKVKNLNDFSIRKAYLSGLINKKHYDEIKNMYEHYVPLRGWHDDYAGDIFEYVNAGQSMDTLQGVVKKAYGRTTRAGNILGTMASMANTAIVQGNKNLVAQKFLNLALNYGNKSGLLMVSKQWYEETASGELVPLYPSLKEGMSATEMQQRIEEFEAEMEEAKKSGTKKIYTRSFGDNMPQNFQKWQEKQHSIRALRNGVEHTIYVLGNPKAAQAFNGLLTPESQVNAVQDIIMKVMRFQAMMQTSLSPEFVISNFQRDVLTAATGTYIKYGWGAGKDFASNLTKVMPVSGLQEGNPFGIYNLIGKYNKGTLDKTNDIERMFDEFVRKGGMTGISSITRAEEFEKQMEKSVKRIKRGKLDVPQQLWEDLADGIEFMNKGIENATRFAAYMTSRKMGKNVTDSIFDAKECSVNFNMKGSGAWGNLWMRRYILYANPALQSLRMLGTWYEASPKRFMGVFSTVLTASILTAMLGYACGGDDGDDNDWYKLNEFNRYNYISVKAGNGFAHWSLPQEMRPVWALGQIVFDWSNGRVSAPIAINSMATQLNNLSPMAFFSGGSDNDDSFWKTAVKAWTPTVAADFMDAYAWNENFLGKNITYRNDWNKEAPEWRKAGKDTPKWAVNLSRAWNKATGGADNRKSWWDSPALNPSAVYYIMSSQFGGMGTLATKLSRAFEQWQDPEQEVEARNIPFVSKFWVTVGDDYSKNRVLNEEFKSIWNEWKLTDYEIKHNESDLEKGLITDEEYANLEADKKYLANKIRYEALEDLMKDYNTLMRKRNDENDNPLLDEEILELKKEVVERAKMLDK
ncbi:LPD38 domain-containing protein [Hoylesella nanceiensis]|uniref:MuF-C-terminal domain-containing protein n=1 Tax=Hoylesella nanceiensis TaxID=425941 RepID=UPI0028E40614|nr:LPD38 domain-containing protein [Hoylesella nanceiensis]